MAQVIPLLYYGAFLGEIRRHPLVFALMMFLVRIVGQIMLHISCIARRDPNFWPKTLTFFGLDIANVEELFLCKCINDVLLVFGLPMSFGCDALALPILQDILGGAILSILQVALFMESSYLSVTAILIFVKLLGIYMLCVNYNLTTSSLSMLVVMCGFMRMHPFENPKISGSLVIVIFWCYCMVRNTPCFILGLLRFVDKLMANLHRPMDVLQDYASVDLVTVALFGVLTSLKVVWDQWTTISFWNVPWIVVEHLGQTPIGVLCVSLSFCMISCAVNYHCLVAVSYLVRFPYYEDISSTGFFSGLFCLLLWVDAGRNPDQTTLQKTAALSLSALWTGTLYLLVRSMRMVLKRDLTMRPLWSFLCIMLLGWLLWGICFLSSFDFFDPYFKKSDQHSLTIGIGSQHVLMSSILFVDVFKCCIYYIVNKTEILGSPIKWESLFYKLNFIQGAFRAIFTCYSCLLCMWVFRQSKHDQLYTFLGVCGTNLRVFYFNCRYFVETQSRNARALILIQGMADATPEQIAHHNDNCSVCWSAMYHCSVKVTPCDHLFHAFCLLKCVHNSSACPMCRAELSRNEAVANDTEDEEVNPGPE